MDGLPPHQQEGKDEQESHVSSLKKGEERHGVCKQNHCPVHDLIRRRIVSRELLITGDRLDNAFWSDIYRYQPYYQGAQSRLLPFWPTGG